MACSVLVKYGTMMQCLGNAPSSAWHLPPSDGPKESASALHRRHLSSSCWREHGDIYFLLLITDGRIANASLSHRACSGSRPHLGRASRRDSAHVNAKRTDILGAVPDGSVMNAHPSRHVISQTDCVVDTCRKGRRAKRLWRSCRPGPLSSTNERFSTEQLLLVLCTYI
jgi:hypothetical protein